MAGYKCLALSQEMFCGRFRGKHPAYVIVENPLPKDAKVKEMRINPGTGELEFMIYSDQFEFTGPGRPIPYVETPMAEEER